MVPNVSLDAVSCVSKAQCVAVGSMPIPPPSQTVVGVIVTITDGVPGPVVEVGSTLGLTSVDCVSTTTCYAAGTDPYAPPGAPYPNTGGVIVTIENGSAADIAGVPVPSYGPGMPGYAYLYGIGCSGTTTCMAVGYAGALGGFAVNLKNGQLGKEGDLLPISEDSVNGIECVQDDWCVINARTEKGRDSAVGFTEKVKIGLRRGLPVIPGPSVAYTNLQGGDCHHNDLQFCMVAGSPVRTGPGIVLLVNGGRAVQVPGTNLLDDISCAGEYWCVAVGQSSFGEGALVPIGWEDPMGVHSVAGTSTFNGVSCAATGYCVAVGTAPTGGVVDSFRVWG